MARKGKELDEPSAGRGDVTTAPALPAWKAFVVQFGRESSGEAGVFTGRVEHLSSGRRAHFQSREEMLLVLARQLAELEDEPK